VSDTFVELTQCLRLAAFHVWLRHHHRLSQFFLVARDFTVQAQAVYTDGSTQTYTLAFDTVTNNSLFFAAVNNPENIKEVNFTAQQNSTANYGVLSIGMQN
jgi:hypothetical protein